MQELHPAYLQSQVRQSKYLAVEATKIWHMGVIQAASGPPAHCPICQAICVEPKGLWCAQNWVLSCILDREPRTTGRKLTSPADQVAVSVSG